MNYLPLILLGVLLNAGAQLLLKQGMHRTGTFAFAWNQLVPVGSRVATDPYILGGLSAYVVSVLVWLLVLSRVEVSYAYPMLSVGYIVNAIAALYLFQENLSPLRMAGILVITLGVALVARS